jgi:hypothetical protein
VRFKADVGGVEQQGISLTHPAATGGCRVREGGRVGSTKTVMGQVLGGGEMGLKRSKNAFFLTSSLRLGVWWVIPDGLVCEIGRPDLRIFPPKNFSWDVVVGSGV